jgi:hypothetical protein
VGSWLLAGLLGVTDSKVTPTQLCTHYVWLVVLLAPNKREQATPSVHTAVWGDHLSGSSVGAARA